MRSNTAISMSNIIGEVQKRKYSLMGPAKAASELQSLISLSDLNEFETRRRIAMVSAHLKLPEEACAHLSAARKSVLWAWIVLATTIVEASAGTRLFEEGRSGDAVFYLLTGCVRLESEKRDDEDEPDVWHPIGAEALVGTPHTYEPHLCLV